MRRFTQSGGGFLDQDQIPIVTSVHLQTPDGVRSAKSDGGEFRFQVLAPGTYALTLHAPDGYIASPPSARLEYPQQPRCRQPAVRARPTTAASPDV